MNMCDVVETWWCVVVDVDGENELWRWVDREAPAFFVSRDEAREAARVARVRHKKARVRKADVLVFAAGRGR